MRQPLPVSHLFPEGQFYRASHYAMRKLIMHVFGCAITIIVPLMTRPCMVGLSRFRYSAAPTGDRAISGPGPGAAFRRALKEAGYVESQNVKIEY